MTSSARKVDDAKLPAVTVVIPTWNGRSHLAACLDALELLAYPQDRIEVVVVDNASTDGSEALASGRSLNIRWIRNQMNLGFAEACNQGVRDARSGLVAFLNNDARPHQQWLVELVEHLEGRPDVAAAGSVVLDWDGGHIDFAGAGMTPFGRGVQIGFGADAADAPAEPIPILFANGAAMIVRRDVFLDAGGFDERFFAYYEDVDLGWRLWVLGWRVELVPASIVYHRHHGTSRRFPAGVTDVLMTRNAVITVVKNYGDDTLSLLLPVLLLAEVRRARFAPPATAARFRPGGRDRIGAAQRLRYADHFGTGGRVRAGVVGVARLRRGFRFQILGVLRRVLAPRSQIVEPRGVAVGVAFGDLLDVWPDIIAERGRIQARRRRDDAEIVPLLRLEAQTRATRSSRVRSDDVFEAFYRALEGIGLGWLVPGA